jgi:Holliday junction resolvasome RuvABC endonuclease subunit
VGMEENREDEEVKKYIYAFDLSMSNTGIAIFDSNDGSLVYLTSIDTKREKNYAGKLKLIADKILELRNKYVVDKVVIENAFSRFNTSTQVLYRVHGLINYLFWDVPEQIYYAATTIKKTVGGRGNLTKEEIKNVVSMKYPGWEFKTDDESDAVSVGDCYFIEKNKLNNIELENQKRG